MKTNARTSLGFVVLLSAMILSPVQSQWVDRDDPSGAIDTQLLSLIRSQFGNDYRVAFSVLDSAIKRNETTSDSGEMSDPYGSLRGCILFGADKVNSSDSKHGIMGIYKDGQIIWHSEPIFKGEWYGIYTIKDINRDGKVDILVEWTPGAQMIMVTHLWIITWDGSTGAIINQVNPRTGNTTIHAAENMFDIIEGGIVSASMLRGYWPEEEDVSEWIPNVQISTLPYVTYSWNGSQYGVWPLTRQVPGSDFLPANVLSVQVTCAVSSLQDSLSFRYHWENSPSSKQRMERFHLAGVQNSFHSVEPMNWRFIGWMRHLPVASWEVEGLDRFKYSLPPGNSQDGITIHAQALPAIGTFHAQGSRPSPDFGLDLSDIGEQYQNDMLNNSFIGVTIVPVDTPEPFVPLDFLDTISNYTTQARTVGWIKDQPTASVYLGRFNAAKACLQQNNIASTRATLQQVLQDVNVDSTSNLTSEAYALIRYNTEYLLEHLPVLPPPDTKK